MRIRESSSRVVLAAVVLAALVAMPAISEEATPKVATMQAGPGGISWAPHVAFDKIVLTVAGGDVVITEEFDGGNPYFAPVDAEGYQLADGNYSWELTVVPRALDANDNTFRSDRLSEDGRSISKGEAPEGLVQSGSFTIINGAIADPGVSEPESGRSAPRAADASADIDDSDAANQ